MTRDGHTPSQRRTWDAWTVPGQFDTLETELADLAHPERALQHRRERRLSSGFALIRVLGFPQHYVRSVLGTDLGIEWSTTSFKGLRGATNRQPARQMNSGSVDGLLEK